MLNKKSLYSETKLCFTVICHVQLQSTAQDLLIGLNKTKPRYSQTSSQAKHSKMFSGLVKLTSWEKKLKIKQLL